MSVMGYFQNRTVRLFKQDGAGSRYVNVPARALYLQRVEFPVRRLCRSEGNCPLGLKCLHSEANGLLEVLVSEETTGSLTDLIEKFLTSGSAKRSFRYDREHRYPFFDRVFFHPYMVDMAEIVFSIRDQQNYTPWPVWVSQSTKLMLACSLDCIIDRGTTSEPCSIQRSFCL